MNFSPCLPSSPPRSYLQPGIKPLVEVRYLINVNMLLAKSNPVFTILEFHKKKHVESATNKKKHKSFDFERSSHVSEQSLHIENKW